LTQKRALFPAFSWREVTSGTMRKIGIHLIIHHQQVTQKMKLLKRGKRFDACLRRFHVVTAFDSGLPDPRKQSNIQG